MKNTTSSDTLAILSCWVPLIADHGHHGLSWPKRAVIATKTRRGYKEAWLGYHQRTVSNEVLAIQLGFEGRQKKHLRFQARGEVTKVVFWNTGWWFGTMEFYFSIQLGMSSFQLTFTHIFQRGRSTTSQIYINHKHS